MANHGSSTGLKLALIAYIFLFSLKLAIYFITGVLVLFVEALHSLADMIVSSFLLIAAIWSRKPPDVSHMYGYGRAQNIAALVASTIFISFTSLEGYREAIPKLFGEWEASYQSLDLALIFILISIVVSTIPLLKLLREKKKGSSEKAQMIELINDELALIAALVGIILIIQGIYWADPLASVIVSTVIAINATLLFKENASFLLGRSPGLEFLVRVESTVKSVAGVLDIHELRAEYIAPDSIYTSMHIHVARGTPIEEAHRIAKQVRELLEQEIGCKYCIIHVGFAEQ